MRRCTQNFHLGPHSARPDQDPRHSAAPRAAPHGPGRHRSTFNIEVCNIENHSCRKERRSPPARGAEDYRAAPQKWRRRARCWSRARCPLTPAGPSVGAGPRRSRARRGEQGPAKASSNKSYAQNRGEHGPGAGPRQSSISAASRVPAPPPNS